MKFFHNKFIVICKSYDIVHEFFNIYERQTCEKCIELKDKFIF